MGLLDAVFSTRLAVAGVEAATRKILNFPAGFTFTDDPTNLRTNISLALTAAALADHAVTNAKLRQSTARSLIGRAAGSDGDVADITANLDDRFLARTGGVLGFVQLALGMIPDGLITAPKLASAVLDLNFVFSASTSITISSATHKRKVLVCTSASPVAVTFPAEGTDNMGDGALQEVIQWGAGQITYAGTGFTIRSDGGKLKSSARYTSAFFKKLPTADAGANEWQATGSLTV